MAVNDPRTSVRGGADVTIKQLRAFIGIARLGSFTRAADAMLLSQPALTIIIRKLEDAVGVSLFDRTTRRVVLSERGRDLLPIADRLVKDLDLAVEDVRGFAEYRRGRVGISALYSVASVLLPTVLSSFASSYPAISINLRDDNSSDVRRRVRTNEVDLGFGGRDQEDRALEFRPCFCDQMVAVARPDHPVMKLSRNITWTDLARNDFIGLGQGSGIYPILQRVKKLPDAVKVPRLEISSRVTMEAILETGLGVTVLPALAVAGYANRSIIFKPVSDPMVTRDVCLITRKDRELSPAAQKIVPMILDHIEDFCDGNKMITYLMRRPEKKTSRRSNGMLIEGRPPRGRPLSEGSVKRRSAV